MTVKILLIINGAVAAATPEMINECMSESGATPEMLQSIQPGDLNVPDEVQCMNKCLGIKMEILNEDGSLNEERFSGMVPPNFPEDRRQKIIQKCTAITGKNKCYIAHQMLTCLGFKLGYNNNGKSDAIAECTAETGVDLKTASAAGNDPDHNVKCFFTCIMKKKKFANKNGELNKELMSPASVSPNVPQEKREEIKEMLQYCSDITGSDECENGFNLANCLGPLMARRAQH